jgi:hypothetical protein
MYFSFFWNISKLSITESILLSLVYGIVSGLDEFDALSGSVGTGQS